MKSAKVAAAKKVVLIVRKNRGDTTKGTEVAVEAVEAEVERAMRMKNVTAVEAAEKRNKSIFLAIELSLAQLKDAWFPAMH